MKSTNGCGGRAGGCGSPAGDEPSAGAGLFTSPARAELPFCACDEARTREPPPPPVPEPEPACARATESVEVGLGVVLSPRHASGERPVASARTAASTFTILSRRSVHSVWCCAQQRRDYRCNYCTVCMYSSCVLVGGVRTFRSGWQFVLASFSFFAERVE